VSIRRLSPKSIKSFIWTESMDLSIKLNKQTNKLLALGPRANYTDRLTAACRRS
jgi:hypothetical protein